MKKLFATIIKGVVLSGAILLASCTPKNIAYMQDIDNAAIAEATIKPITAQPEDKLSIIVTSRNSELTRPFNLPVVSSRLGNTPNENKKEFNSPSTSSSSGSYESLAYYTVSPKGNIDFPELGELHIQGMTRSEIAAYIKGELVGRGFLKDPVVTVEFINTGINIIGEVASPGRYVINRDHLTVIDAIALAGDLTIQGQRENVLVIREENGKRQSYRIDLTNSNQFLNSPAYYLRQGDVIYVEPNGVKKRQTTVNGNTALSASFWVSVASLLTSVAVLIFK